MLATLLLVAAETAEKARPLSAKSLLVTLAVIVAVCAAILLAGFGYFSSSDNNSSTNH